MLALFANLDLYMVPLSFQILPHRTEKAVFI